MREGVRTASNDEFTTFGFTPEPVHIQNINAYSGDGNFEKSLPLSCHKENSFLLGESVGNAAATDFRSGGLAAAQAFYIVFTGSIHAVSLSCR